ncbi:hypothetical protein L3N51_02419 [Metallosphaera sp. J1]|uniref:hypothetical protein n=1 Tax=Metallosphaera javensis (ex Hofmann et al. 2022) TaxID=99938 RepID=UPI001EDE91F0|nr:hypothetical protein [Metallosphaera javensis (ex Hofmann et al. 2022)]MCG3110122.1 hypothetical protein [Metallosphaera javensis (ex Hofmann et al. 2022)]
MKLMNHNDRYMCVKYDDLCGGADLICMEKGGTNRDSLYLVERKSSLNPNSRKRALDQIRRSLEKLRIVPKNIFIVYGEMRDNDERQNFASQVSLIEQRFKVKVSEVSLGTEDLDKELVDLISTFND